MLLSRTDPRELARQAHEQYTALLGGTGKPAQGSPPAPVVENLENVRALDCPTTRVYRGREYTVYPISYTDGLDLQALIGRIGSAALRGDGDAIRAEYAVAVRMFRRLMIPVGWRRWIRDILPNPFASISEREVDDLLDFFWQCRTGETFLTSVRRQVGGNTL